MGRSTDFRSVVSQGEALKSIDPRIINRSIAQSADWISICLVNFNSTPFTAPLSTHKTQQAAAFLGASPLRAPANAAAAARPFQRLAGKTLKPTLIINHSSEETLDKAQKEALILDASKIVAKTLGKPESYVMVGLNEATMSFGGKVGPTAFAYIASIGRIGPETNPEAASELTALISERLSIPKNRIFIQFMDSSGANFAWQGNTFG